MSLKSSTIIGGSGANKRRELDFYPTPTECTVALMNFMKFPKMRIWEPCCGDGAISKVLLEYGHDVFSSDIHTDYGEEMDFFFVREVGCDAIITNPPFNLSEEFIIKSIQTCDIVCMLLKSQYWHAKKRQSLFNKSVPEWVLPLTWRPDFTNGGNGSPTMDMCWTVWTKNKSFTKYHLLSKP